jgi:hypothetical protein
MHLARLLRMIPGVVWWLLLVSLPAAPVLDALLRVADVGVDAAGVLREWKCGGEGIAKLLWCRMEWYRGVVVLCIRS